MFLFKISVKFSCIFIIFVQPVKSSYPYVAFCIFATPVSKIGTDCRRIFLFTLKPVNLFALNAVQPMTGTCGYQYSPLLSLKISEIFPAVIGWVSSFWGVSIYTPRSLPMSMESLCIYNFLIYPSLSGNL